METKNIDISILGETGRTIEINGNEETGYVFITTEENMTMESVWVSSEDFNKIIWALKASEVI